MWITRRQDRWAGDFALDSCPQEAADRVESFNNLRGDAAMRRCGDAAMRRCGDAAMRRCGDAAMRRCGDAAMRRCGDAAMRRCGDAAMTQTKTKLNSSPAATGSA
ncbi:hypothetical protein [Amycolatopsis sp. WQ 127309]|uniref:hypothetical protein n=1 Tax=Amycolatopsis sp. WQ 127309 TaxID=2932773 RepID=UPI001FF5E38D|nr:hypothetical protein [Amycolatopsis sp. WQ 127309]UOZ09513.1 hypothetical protein MUY22_15065 [Amycolatopsis sp. WQ 127309]